jgi:hypothetical protein
MYYDSTSGVKELKMDKSGANKNKRKNFSPKCASSAEESEPSVATPFVSSDKLKEIAATMTELLNIYGLPVSTGDIFEIMKRRERNEVDEKGEFSFFFFVIEKYDRMVRLDNNLQEPPTPPETPVTIRPKVEYSDDSSSRYSKSNDNTDEEDSNYFNEESSDRFSGKETTSNMGHRKQALPVDVSPSIGVKTELLMNGN